jgi:aldose 1-epimerase
LNSELQAKIEKRPFGKLADGTPVSLYLLTNRNGIEAQISEYGGAVVALKTPDRERQFADIVLGYDDPRSYEEDSFFIGTLIGRCANRIANGKFSLGGVEYSLVKNDGANHLHGGVRGFHKVMWQARELQTEDESGLEVSHLSLEGDEGYPGNALVKVTYTITSNDELRIEYTATTDRPTIVNLTNHSYFNLRGAGSGNILDHLLSINASSFTPINETQTPTGELRPVNNTPFDFTKATAIGSRIENDDEQLRIGRGYDHNFVLEKKGRELSLAAEVHEPSTGRSLEMWTTEPGMQLYSGNFLDGVKGKAGKIYNRRDGICLEAQHFPDAPNHRSFPSIGLTPGESYAQTTVYRFKVTGASGR